MVVHTCIAWNESADRSGALAGILAATPETNFINTGDTIELNRRMNKIAMLYAVSWLLPESGVPLNSGYAYAPEEIKLTSATIGHIPIRLQKGMQCGVHPDVGATMLGKRPLQESRAFANLIGLVYDWRDRPYGLIPPGEPITCSGFEQDEAGSAHNLCVVAIVSDGPIRKGFCRAPTLTYKAVAAGAATANVWTTQSITLTDTIPDGYYDLIGARVEGPSTLAARFVLKNSPIRPAVIPVHHECAPDHPFSEFWGRGYTFKYPGELPDIEMLCGTTDTPKLELRIVKRA